METLLFPEEQVFRPTIQKKTDRLLSVFEQILSKYAMKSTN